MIRPLAGERSLLFIGLPGKSGTIFSFRVTEIRLILSSQWFSALSSRGRFAQIKRVYYLKGVRHLRRIIIIDPLAESTEVTSNWSMGWANSGSLVRLLCRASCRYIAIFVLVFASQVVCLRMTSIRSFHLRHRYKHQFVVQVQQLGLYIRFRHIKRVDTIATPRTCMRRCGVPINRHPSIITYSEAN
jgi:hypothetical protein